MINHSTAPECRWPNGTDVLKVARLDGLAAAGVEAATAALVVGRIDITESRIGEQMIVLDRHMHLAGDDGFQGVKIKLVGRVVWRRPVDEGHSHHAVAGTGLWLWIGSRIYGGIAPHI